MLKKVILLVWMAAAPFTMAFSSVYYVAVDGADTNTGTIESPFASIQRAQTLAVAGDTVYIRGGKYMVSQSKIARYESIWAYVFELNKSGSQGKPICYWAYPGEKPVFDFSAVKPANYRILAFYVTGSWIHLKGFEVTGVQVTITTHTQSECFENRGSNNIYEQLVMHDGQAIGIYIIRGGNNLVLNCDAYNNYDYTSETGKGGNTDGFGCHVPKGNTGNVFRGCRAWFNSDDGYDCISCGEPVLFENCWAFYNGYSTSFGSLGDGNGFKAGGYGSTALSSLPNPAPSNTVRFCLAVRNKASGFYSNHHLAGSTWLNNSAYMNATNFNMLNREGFTESGYLKDVNGYNHVLKNNLGYKARSSELSNIDKTKCTLSNNSFDLSVSISDADFESLNQSLLTQARQADGSLPDIGFMKLKPSSDLIDKGVNVGFSYIGNAPDLGAFEYNPGSEYFPIHININGQGSIEMDPAKEEFESGTKVTITAIPAEGWKFRGWSGKVYTALSTITVTVTDTVELNANFSEITGISELDHTKSNALDMLIYPNPATVKATVSFTLPQKSEVSMLLYSMKGEELLQFGKMEFNAGHNTMEVPLSYVIPGIYLLALDVDHHTFAQQMVIQ